MLRHRWCICANCPQEVQEESAGLLQAKQKQSLDGDSKEEDVWGNDYKIIRTEQKCGLVEGHTSFEMRRMTKEPTSWSV